MRDDREAVVPLDGLRVNFGKSLPSNPRVLMVHPGPQFSVADVYDGWVSGLSELGCQVVGFNLNDRLDFYTQALMDRHGEIRKAFSEPAAMSLALKGLEAACYEFWPDVVLIVSGFYVQPAHMDLMRSRGHKVVLVHTESPYEDDRQLTRAPHADFNILNDPTNLERFQAVAPAAYFPHAYDPARHHPRPAVKGCESEFCFVGTGYPSRIEFFEKVDWAGIDVTFAGNWQALDFGSPLLPFLAHPKEACCSNGETVDLYSSTLMSANLYRREASFSADGWACGPREIELAACGVPFLRDRRGEGDELFPMLPCFETPDEFGAALRWWLDHPESRAQAAQAARAAVAERTFRNNAARLLALL